MMRGREYQASDEETVSKEHAQSGMLSIIRDEQRRNGLPNPKGTDEEVLNLVRQLYEKIVPSSVWESNPRPFSVSGK